MSLKIFQLHFNAAVHLSDVRSDYGKSEKMIHSDSLTAAIMQTWAVLGKSEWISKDYGFTISSLFPFTTVADKPVYFLPKPYTGLNIPKGNSDTSLAKKAKKIQYFDVNYFQKALLQALVNPTENDYKGGYLTNQDIEKDFLQSNVSIRIRKPRNDSEDAEPFYMEQLIFKKGAGFWGIADFENSEAEQRFIIAMNYLQEAGVGTDRNVGHGQFDFKWDIESTLPFGTEQHEYGLCLSLFCPENHQQLSKMLDEKARYETIKRGGWISEPYNTLRKRSVMMFKEGSVFKMPNSESIQGAVLNLQPDILKNHAIWRSGKAIFLPINWKG